VNAPREVGPHDLEQPRAGLAFELDGTLVDGVHLHVLARQDALDQWGIELSVWRIQRKIRMCGEPFANALLPRDRTRGDFGGRRAPSHRLHAKAHAERSRREAHVCEDPGDLPRHLDEVGLRTG
jgi:hypothetical protein